jgi:hypothetical protein
VLAARLRAPSGAERCRLAHREWLGELFHGGLALGEAGDDRATGGIGERAEDQAMDGFVAGPNDEVDQVFSCG